MLRSLTIILMLIWPFLANDFFLIGGGKEQLGLFWGFDIFFFLVIPSLTLFILFKRKWVTTSEAGISQPLQPISFIAGVGIFALLLVLLRRGLDPWLYFWFPGGLSTGFYNMFPESQPLRILTVAYASITAGFFEEVIGRGIITSQIEKHVKSSVAVVGLSCMIFALLHWSQSPGHLVSCFLWAILPTIWYLKRRNVWAPIVAHTLYDFVIFNRWT